MIYYLRKKNLLNEKYHQNLKKLKKKSKKCLKIMHTVIIFKKRFSEIFHYFPLKKNASTLQFYMMNKNFTRKHAIAKNWSGNASHRWIICIIIYDAMRWTLSRKRANVRGKEMERENQERMQNNNIHRNDVSDHKF